MANFKVGDRVKWVTNSPHWVNPVPVGTTGAIVLQHPLALPSEVTVLCDEPLPDGGGPLRYALPWELVPLTDPRASQFVEDMERFARVVNVPLVPVQ